MFRKYGPYAAIAAVAVIGLSVYVVSSDEHLAETLAAEAPAAKASSGRTTTTTRPAPRGTKIEKAAADCADTQDFGPEVVDLVGDEGHSISFDTRGSDDYTEPAVSYETVACVLLVLDVPDSVVGRMDATRALDGMVTADWDEFTATWTYHPDAGMHLIVEEA